MESVKCFSLALEGFEVAGAWISPSHDGYVQPKAGTPGRGVACQSLLRAVEARKLGTIGHGLSCHLRLSISQPWSLSVW